MWELESKGSLAGLLLALGRSEPALATVEMVLPQLDEVGLPGSREPFRTYWNCYRVLDSVADPRADSLLTTACAALMSQAETIEDLQQRQSFLQNIPSHRSIMEAGAQ